MVKKKQKYKISGPLKEVSQTEKLKKQMKQDITHLAGLTKWKTRDHYKGKQKNRALTDVVDKKKKDSNPRCNSWVKKKKKEKK